MVIDPPGMKEILTYWALPFVGTKHHLGLSLLSLVFLSLYLLSFLYCVLKYDIEGRHFQALLSTNPSDITIDRNINPYCYVYV